jgi:hypothetical protein
VKLLAAFAVFCTLSLPCAAAVPRLIQIFPSGSELPANHLKFYLEFSEPMREGVFLEHCRLLDERGAEVNDPFRETELWSDDRRRLTLWLHPGRQKTGVNLNVDFGPVLQPGRSYTLVVSGRWPSAAGVPLGHETQKTFRAGARATSRLEANEWKIAPPRSASTDPLEVRFPAPLDHALLGRCLRVLDVQGVQIEGSAVISDGETRWTFTPREPWQNKGYRLAVETILEDLAGNSLARPFEVDLDGPPRRSVSGVIELAFRPGAPNR